MKQIELTRLEFPINSRSPKWILDFGWNKGDLILHFYVSPKIINHLDQLLDPIFKEVFDLSIIDREAFTQSLHEQLEKGELDQTNYFKKMEEFSNRDGVQKAQTYLEGDGLFHKGLKEIASWCYIIKRAQTMHYIDTKLDSLVKKINDLLV